MAKLIHFDPKEAKIPAAGGEVKLRIKNPDTKKYFYWVELSDPQNFTIDLQPMDYIAMGANRICTVTKKAGGTECKITFRWYPAPANPNQDFELPEKPLGQCEAIIKSG